MPKYVIVGAGAVGTATARLLAARGEEVCVLTRSGSGPNLPGVQRLRCDATDAAALADASRGAAALLNCAAPAYHRWAADWPPLADALLETAERTGAVLATVSNLYAYGKVTAPMTETTPMRPNGPKSRVRAQMWTDARARHESGRLRATEIRASDYVGPHSQSHLGDRVVPRLPAGKNVQVLPHADVLHSWTYVEDVARLLSVVADDQRAWGRVWHVPTTAPRTARDAVADLAEAAGVGTVTVGEVPAVVLRMMALFSPAMREIPEIAHQFTKPFVIDSSAAESTFGLRPTPWSDVVQATVEHYRSLARTAARA